MSEMWQEAMIAAFREMMNRAVLFLPKLMARNGMAREAVAHAHS